MLLTELREALVPRFQVLRELGSGGMGYVFLARDPALKRMVAIKALAPERVDDDTARERFVREAEAAAMVSHPNIVAVHEVGTLPHSRTPYFVMQLVEGETLDEAFPGGAPAAAARAQRVIGEIAAALAAAHAHGLVHRDIKPRNVIIERETGRAVVLDFGISAALRVHSGEAPVTRLTQSGAYIGTPAYMSPEQATSGELSDRSDIYSLGVVAFELLTGHVPFVGAGPMAVIAAHLKDAPPSLTKLRRDLASEFAHLIDRCLAKDPAARPSAREIAHYLIPSSHPHIEWPPPGLERLRGMGARLLLVLGLAAAASTVFFAVAALQPRLGSPLWHEGERSTLWGAVGDPGAALERAAGGVEREFTEQVDATPIWTFVLGFAFVTLGALVPVVAVLGWRLGSWIRAGRKAGYSWRVLLDVAWDHWRDTPELRNGMGMFALAHESERERVLSARRRQGALAEACIVLTLFAPVFWLLGVTGGWGETSASVLPAGELALLYMPPLVALVGMLLGRLPYVRLARRLGIRRSWRHRFAPPAVRSELVSAWIENFGERPAVASRPPPRFALAVLPALAAIFALGAAAVVIVVTLVVESRLLPAREQAATWLASFENDSLRPIRRERVAQVIGDAARVRATNTAPDEEGARLLMRRAALTGTNDSLWDVGATTAAPWPADTTIVDNEQILAILARLPGSLGAEERGALRAAASSPWLEPWRRVARSTPLPPFWGYRRDFPGVASPLALPHRASLGFRELADRNTAAAVLAIAEGDVAHALERARENASAGGQLMRSPSLLDLAIGVTIVSSAAHLLAEIARVSGDHNLADETAQLRDVLRRVRSEAYLGWSGVLPLTADPASPIGLRFLGDRSLLIAQRADMSIALVTGYCLNAREILFGLDPRRRQALDSAATLMSDLPRADELLRLNRRWLDRLISDPAAALSADAPGGLRFLGWMGLGGLRARLAFCGQTF